MKYISIVLVATLFVACVPQEQVEVKKENISIEEEDIVIEDLVKIPQDISYYVKDINTSKLYDIQKKYEASYFSVWDIQKPPLSLKETQWPFEAFNSSKSYGENLQPLEEDFFDAMRVQSNSHAYATLNQKALTIKHANIRAFPTNKPLLHDPSIAGEGFPFDYLQNSSINANVPLFISHYSLDKQWVFIFNSFTFGWLKTNEIVFMDDTHVEEWKNAQQIMIVKEGVPLYTKEGLALFDTRIGMMFALVSEDENTYTILSVSRYKNHQAMFHKSIIEKNVGSKGILMFNKANIESIIGEISKTKYGWGGVYSQRDCSSTLMDFYTPFGIWLPRNSSKQAQIGEVLNLKKLNDEDKIQFIKEEGIPFQTLLYRKGHIVLYAGIVEDEIIVYQNVWGIRTKKDGVEGRFIIGKTVFSTLKLGNELKDYDESAELLRNIESMNILTR